MKRGKKLIRNICIIMILLGCMYYFGGFYLSKEECIKDSLRGLSAKENEVIAEIQNGKFITSIVISEEEKMVAIHGTIKYGPLYRTGSGSHGHKIDDDECIDVEGSWSHDRGTMVIVIYRNDKNIEKVEIKFEDGNTTSVDEWTKDFAVLSLETKDWVCGTYRAYDSVGNFIGEIEY